MKRSCAMALAAWLVALAGAAMAADPYPTRPVTMVVPFGPGSGTDMISRLIGQHLGIALKQTIVVENKAGANGTIAAMQVARAAPDGYMLLMGTNSTHSAAPSLMRNLAYDPLRDFSPVARAGSYIFMLVIDPRLPANSVQELIAHAKANPGKLSFASGNTSGIVAGETFKRRAGIDIFHVPYKSTPPAINDLIAGRVSLMMVDLTAALPQVQAGNLRALAVTTRERSPNLPGVPSLHEAGLTNFEINPWAGVFAPASTPKDIIVRLNQELRPIIDSQEIKSKLAVAGFDAFSSSPEELGEFTKSALVKWTQMIKDAGIEAE